MASDAWLSLPSRHPTFLPRPRLLRPPCAVASTSTSSRCRTGCQGWRRHRIWAAQAADQDQQGGGVQQQQQQRGDDAVVDTNVLPYCSIDRKDKKTIGEMEQEFLQALQAFYYDKKAIMSNEEFDNLKEELMWEGSSVVMLSPDEQRLLEASMAYVAGNPIMTDAEFDELKLRLRREVKSYKKVQGAVCGVERFFFLDDLTGFEITYLLELWEFVGIRFCIPVDYTPRNS
uniref:Uncharacterized protein n=1 Tax=Leersia perrieri TaxID=77586 RepID=A0A0D9X6L9_9ORYZ